MTKAECLLAELHGLRVTLRAVRGRLRFSPKAAVTPALRDRIAEQKSEIIALLEAAEEAVADSHGSPGAVVEMACHFEEVVVPLGALLDLGSARLEHSPCACCGGTSWWRLRSGGFWVCARCHPAQPPLEAIETVTVEEAPHG